MGQHTVFVKTSRERCTDRGSIKDRSAMGQRHQRSADRGSIKEMSAMGQGPLLVKRVPWPRKRQRWDCYGSAHRVRQNF